MGRAGVHAGVLVCACAGQGRVFCLAPHTMLCPHMGRNFLEIVRYHRSSYVCVACVGRAGVCACPQVKVKNTISSPYNPIKRG